MLLRFFNFGQDQPREVGIFQSRHKRLLFSYRHAADKDLPVDLVHLAMEENRHFEAKPS